MADAQDDGKTEGEEAEAAATSGPFSIYDAIFEGKEERETLTQQGGRMSPKRKLLETTEASFETSTLPFAQDISPTDALEKLFELFHVKTEAEVARELAAAADPSPRNKQDDDDDELSYILEPTITLEEFNRLRRAVGKKQIKLEQWERALKALVTPEGKDCVRKKDFKALFGPSPYFGGDRVQDIVNTIRADEEWMHFALMLLHRFGTTRKEDNQLVQGYKVMYLEQMRQLQKEYGLEENQVLDESLWERLQELLEIPSARDYLDWVEFSECFRIEIDNRHVFEPRDNPAAVAYAVVANEKVLEAFPVDEVVSRAAFTNLLHMERKKLDDDEWMNVLTDMQDTQHIKHSRTRRNSAVDGTRLEEDNEANTQSGPPVIVRNVRNQILSYEITFDGQDEIGIKLQPDFYGLFLTVASFSGQAEKYRNIIKNQDIVVAIDGESLMFETMAATKTEEDERLAKAENLLAAGGQRKITFHRQDAYFMFDTGEQALYLYIKTISKILRNHRIAISMPRDVSWTLEEDFGVTINDSTNELDSKLLEWHEDDSMLEITMKEDIEQDSSVMIKVIGVIGDNQKRVGPCELTEGELLHEEGNKSKTFPACFVQLFTSWNDQETRIHHNPLQERSIRPYGAYVDKALTPIYMKFEPRESGVKLKSDFFGQCAVVDPSEKIPKLSQAGRLGVQQLDILASVDFIDQNDVLTCINCIRPFPLAKNQKGDEHLNAVNERLKQCHKSGHKYGLTFLRLNAHYFHENAITTLSVHLPTEVTENVVINVQMPSAEWRVVGPLTTTVITPEDAKIKEAFWDSQQNTLQMAVDVLPGFPVSDITVEIKGLASGNIDIQGISAEIDTRCVGPGEIVGVHDASEGNPPEVEVQLHSNWHDFVVVHQGLEASKVVNMLKKHDITPARLWENLEYTNLIFDMFKTSETAEFLAMSDMNRLAAIVCGNDKKLSINNWENLCHAMGAEPNIGLTRQQFGCCWYDVLEQSSHAAKDTYVNLHTAYRLFEELIIIFQLKDDKHITQEIIKNTNLTKETIKNFAVFAGIPARAVLKERTKEWSWETFAQIMCGSHKSVKPVDNAMELWMRIHFGRKLFFDYSEKGKPGVRQVLQSGRMRQRHLSDLLTAARISDPKLTNEHWKKICKSMGNEDTEGLTLGDFLVVYSGPMLKSRHTVADWYRIETFKLLPDRRVRKEAIKEALLSVAPEKVNVEDVAAKAIEQAANVEDLFQDLRSQGLEFSKTDDIEEKESTTFAFDAELAAKRKSRKRGFLSVEVRGIVELTDHILHKNSSVVQEATPEQLYVMFQVTNAEGMKECMPKLQHTSMCRTVKNTLFGDDDITQIYKVCEDELWDHNQTQDLMREMHRAELSVSTCLPGTSDYRAAVAHLHDLERKLTRVMPIQEGAFNGRVFSSLINRDPSPDSIACFPNDQFRLYVDMPDNEANDQLYVVCKLFKCIGAERSRIELKLTHAKEALQKSKDTLDVLSDLVRHQQLQLRRNIAIRHSQGDKTGQAEMWESMSRLKQTREEVNAFRVEIVKKCQDEVDRLEAERLAVIKNEDKNSVKDEEELVRLKDLREKKSKDANKKKSSIKENQRHQEKSKKVTDAKEVRFIGQAFFDLSELLKVLHADKEYTEDLYVFHTERHQDVGRLLLKFQYKCASLQQQAPAIALDTLVYQDNERGNIDKDAKDGKLKAEIPSIYPSHANLEVRWKSDMLQRGDRLFLCREGDASKLSMPYFAFLWDSAKTKDSNNRGDDDRNDINDDSSACDWTVPELLKSVYSQGGDISITDESRRSGTLNLPSSVDLSLLPGVYRLYLIRNDRQNNSRTTLGKTDPLVVQAGLNGVHTSFGTTPLIDVRPFAVSLYVFNANERTGREKAMQNQTETNAESTDYELQNSRKVSVAQELEILKRDLRAAHKNVSGSKGDEKKVAQCQVDRLQMRIEELRLQQFAILTDKTAATNPVNQTAKSLKQEIVPLDRTVFMYRFQGGKPCADTDRILLLPVDVVHVSDMLRSVLVGRLQANDPMQVERVRDTMEKELIEVNNFYSGNLSWTRRFLIILQWFVPCLKRHKPTKQSDAYNMITEATDGTFVWDECRRMYNSASRVAKQNFPYIVRDVLDEIGARKIHLGLHKFEGFTTTGKLAKAADLIKTGLEIRVTSKSTLTEKLAMMKRFKTCFKKSTLEAGMKGIPTDDSQCKDNLTAEEQAEEVVGEEIKLLGPSFEGGQYYVAKYVRRSQDGSTIDGGELCRYGPFFISKPTIAISKFQMLLSAFKLLKLAAQSNECRLFAMGVLHSGLSLIRYFLALVSLSFNISVLAGNFKLNTDRVYVILQTVKFRMAHFFGPFEVALSWIYEVFSRYLKSLILKLDVFEIAGECMTGGLLFFTLALLWCATFVVYVVVQEDLLLKVQKLHTYLGFNPGKALLGFLEQVGALLVIPLYLTIKSCVLFISGQWSNFYHNLHHPPSYAFAMYNLTTSNYGRCHHASVNYGFGVAAIVLIVLFLFVSLPLLLLDLFSWVPLTELEKEEKLEKLAHSFDRKDVGAAVHSNASLVEIRRKTSNLMQRLLCGLCFGKFQRQYNDYKNLKFPELKKKYGYLGLFVMFINIYMNLMLQSMWRSFCTLVGWRLRGPYMYPNEVAAPKSKWRVLDAFCFRFNLAWKLKYLKDKMIMPIVNVCLVTLGFWGETQWKEYNIEERANNCYRMEPSGEIRQLQMMTLHGKIVSLFWLCVPETMVLAYLAEVMNRGPVFGYFLNNQFLQADIPESEREKDPVWRVTQQMAAKGEEDVIYLCQDTCFISTLMKWSSAMTEIISLLLVYPERSHNKTLLIGVALISGVVAPILELNQQLIKLYVDYKETVENAIESVKDAGTKKVTNQTDKYNRPLKIIESVVGVISAIMPKMQINVGRTSTSRSASKAKQLASNVVGTTGASFQIRSGAANLQEEIGGMLTEAQGNAETKAKKMLSDDGGDNNDAKDENDVKESAYNEDIAKAAALEALSTIRPKKQLVTLTAMPQVSYVVLTDALDYGEGEITVNWQVNAKTRFHALDAIGMFPSRSPDDLHIRSMDECICYCPLNKREVEHFGWKPERHTDDGELELVVRQAESLRDLAKEQTENAGDASKDMLHQAHSKMKDMMHDPRLKPLNMKLSEILEDEVKQHKLHEKIPRLTRASSVATTATREISAKKARKVISGQVHFRPANNCVSAENPLHETFIFGNNAGIFQSKYGLQSYEFCYLRHLEVENVEQSEPNRKSLDIIKAKARVAETSSESTSATYEILERFSSNEIQIGTFNIFMSLSSEAAMISKGEKLNLSWTIYGVSYGVLSNRKIRNCIGFYRIKDSSSNTCTKIEVIPTSAYIQAEKNEPCSGRMIVTAPLEPGMYEIRFLFNFFQQAQLHRRCQEFGELEDEMQELRIRSFMEKRSIVEELHRFDLSEPIAWKTARTHTRAWMRAMLISTLHEPVSDSVVQMTSEYAAFLVEKLREKLRHGLINSECAVQGSIRKMLAPLDKNAFMNVLVSVLQISSQVQDQIAAITFLSPTVEDEKKRGDNPEHDELLLPSDNYLLAHGPKMFRLMAINYLSKPSLCGYHDFIDDIVLNHGQLNQTVDRVLDTFSSSCVGLYESAITEAIKDMIKAADALKLTNALQGVDVILQDQCRNHMHGIIRAFIETDCSTGKRWPQSSKAIHDRMTNLRLGTECPDWTPPVVTTFPHSLTPLTRQHFAVRRWIRPKLINKIESILRQRHARLLNGNLDIMKNMFVATIRGLRPGLALAGNPFPSYRDPEANAKSPLYFLQENHDNLTEVTDANDNDEPHAPHRDTANTEAFDAQPGMQDSGNTNDDNGDANQDADGDNDEDEKDNDNDDDEGADDDEDDASND